MQKEHAQIDIDESSVILAVTFQAMKKIVRFHLEHPPDP
jgi:hypothetical protein